MPVVQCPNGKWRIGNGPCVFKSKESAEDAYRGYLKYKGMTSELKTMPDWMRKLFDDRIELAHEWFAHYEEAVDTGIMDALQYAWVQFHKKYTRSKTTGEWVENKK